MTLDKLFGKLSCEYCEILIIYSDGDENKLTEAQKDTFPKLSEIKDFNSIREFRESSAYIMLAPRVLSKKFKENVRGFFERGGKNLYLLIGNLEDTFLKANEFVSYRPDGTVIRKLFEMQGLGRSHCIQISCRDDLGDGYLERAASEFLLTKLVSENLEIKIDCLESMLAKKNQENKRLVNKVNLLNAERKEAEYRLVSEAKKERGEQAKKIEKLEKTISQLSSEKEGLRSESLYHKEKYKATRGSLSFKFGNIFVNAAKSPKALLLLPYTLTIFFIDNAKKKINFELFKKVNNQPTVSGHRNVIEGKADHSSHTEILPTRIGSQDRNILADYLFDTSPKSRWVGVIGEADDIRQESNCEVVALHPNSWEKKVNANQPEKIIINQGGMESGPWSSCKDGLAFSYPYHLLELLKYCKSKAIAIEFVGSEKISIDFLTYK